jgi:hypothetical protein
VAERTQTGDGAAQSAVLGASAELPVSSGPISSEADNMPAHGSTPSETAADPQARNTPEAPLAARADSSVPPPIPAKDAAVIKSPTYTSLKTSTSSPQTTNPAASEAVDPEWAGGTEGDSVLVEKADSSGEDPAVFVDAPRAEIDATISGSDEWNAW